MRSLVFRILFAVLFIPLASCLNEEVCEDVNTLPVRIGYYLNDSLATTPPKISLTTVTAYGLGNDSIIYDNRTNVSQMDLPLNSLTDSCAFILRLPNIQGHNANMNDTVWFIYRRRPILISMDCGFVTFYDLNRVRHTRHLIDSLVIEDSKITNATNEHIKIFPVITAAAGR